MKATLIFNLPEEIHEFDNATQGSKMRSVLWDFDQWLRSKTKYEDLTDEQYQVYQGCRDHLRTLLYEENLDIES
jgi:hypothetical protein